MSNQQRQDHGPPGWAVLTVLGLVIFFGTMYGDRLYAEGRIAAPILLALCALIGIAGLYCLGRKRG